MSLLWNRGPLRHRLHRATDRLQGRAPRVLERIGAVLLMGIALEFLGQVVFAEWFYVRYRRDYAYTVASRLREWNDGFQYILLSMWMLGLAWNLARGWSRRKDGGLFSPLALRIWGVGFAVIATVRILIHPEELVHFELLLWCYAASAACFALAGRRSGRARAAGAEPGHVSSFPEGPPPPIG